MCNKRQDKENASKRGGCSPNTIEFTNMHISLCLAEKIILTFQGSMAVCLDVSWLTTYSVRIRISKPQPEHACQASYGNITEVNFGIAKQKSYYCRYK
jgi:hypothetical protein